MAGAMLDYLIYMSNIDGRETILASFLSSHGQPLRAVAWHLELRCGQMVLEACVGGVRGEPLRGVARGRPPCAILLLWDRMPVHVCVLAAC